MTFWQDRIAPALRTLHLGSVRNQIVAFVLVAILLPTLVTTVASYRRSQRTSGDQIARDLRGVSAEAARETAAWLDARLDELQRSARSYVIAENLSRLQGRDAGLAIGRLRDHLNSIRERAPALETLHVVDARGRVVTSSSGRVGSLRFLADALNGLRAADPFVSDAYWDSSLGKAVVVLAVPVRDADGRLLAAVASKVNLQAVAELLGRTATDDAQSVFLMTDEGRFVITPQVSSAALMQTSLADTTTRALLEPASQTIGYRRADGEDVLAAAARVPGMRWAAVAELPRAATLRPLHELRNVTAVTIAGLLVGLGLLAYVFSLRVARPLGQLSAAAAKVAAGDLAVDPPVGGVGEVGHLTRSFNAIVARLRERESQGELERLSVTDALTGLYNRRHLMATLAAEAQRARRLRRPFSVLLADVDHFKAYNDTQGHVAGDHVLAKIAEILRKQTRAVDCVARYGGEEFLVVLLETTIATAAVVGERIRARVAAEAFGEGGARLTVSVGVAECPAHGDTPESLIASADAAMYEAKNAGRDRVVSAGERGERSAREVVKLEKRGRRARET